ncbi:hypothetical protein FE257_009106 [Aspergillus nanangensis]|uniref:Uncharacterized protein n=1 Tax=Aspergillus nanangensis TaxID=2582783 RepID=A0AAD4GZY2_ASPNN|nr:hypothetical protein FE257_009106 [Aspergillus nanangensis]
MFDSKDQPSSGPEKPAACRRYNICKTCFQRNYTVTSAQDRPLLYGEISSFTHKPDLMLHTGSDTHGPVVAVCKFPKFSSALKVGLGNPDDSYDTQWEDMTKETLGASEYRWSMPFRRPSDGSHGRRTLVWKRTQHVTVEGVTPSKLSTRNYKLVDQWGQLLAVFTSERTYRKCGVLQVNVEYGEDFDLMVFVTCLGLYEKARRRKNKSAGGGGGGAP